MSVFLPICNKKLRAIISYYVFIFNTFGISGIKTGISGTLYCSLILKNTAPGKYPNTVYLTYAFL